MDMQGINGHMLNLQKQQITALRQVIEQQCRIIELLEKKKTGRLRVFLNRTWNAFSKRLSTNIGQWLAGLPLWLLALEGLGLRHLLERLFE